MHSDTLTKIIPALVRASANFKPAVKSATNPHFKSKYVPLEGVVDSINAALLAEGIYATQQTRVEDGNTLLVTMFYHNSGEWIGGEYPVHPVKPDPQALGSAMTYARRYALMALAGIPAEDDDGNAATANVRPMTTKVTPTDGAWEAQSPESQAFLLRLAGEVVSIFNADGGDAAADHLSAQGLDTDEKAAVWTRLESHVRTAITKSIKGKKAA